MRVALWADAPVGIGLGMTSHKCQSAFSRRSAPEYEYSPTQPVTWTLPGMSQRTCRYALEQPCQAVVVRQLVALICVGGETERVTIHEGPVGDGAWRRVSFERDQEGAVAAIVEHVAEDGNVIETFRPARWSADQLIEIEIRDV